MVAGKHTKGMYTSNVEFRCQHCRNPSGDKRKRDVVTRWSIQSAIQMKEETKQDEKYMQHDLKQSNKKVKTTNQVRLTVLVLH